MEIFQNVFEWYMANLNYGTIFLLMAIESSFIPFPSEIVVPFAAWKAAEGTLSLAGVMLASTAGAMTGAVFNYYLCPLAREAGSLPPGRYPLGALSPH